MLWFRRSLHSLKIFWMLKWNIWMLSIGSRGPGVALWSFDCSPQQAHLVMNEWYLYPVLPALRGWLPNQLAVYSDVSSATPTPALAAPSSWYNHPASPSRLLDVGTAKKGRHPRTSSQGIWGSLFAEARQGWFLMDGMWPWDLWWRKGGIEPIWNK